MPEFDPRTPSITRVYDYLLGGNDNFTADRAVGDRLIELFPAVGEGVRENRQFLARAVSWAAGQGVTQFIDLGPGIPTAPNTHETAQAVNPAARVVYVDNDLIALAHLRALAAEGQRGVSVVDGDISDPEKITGVVAKALNPAAPTCLIMGLLLHFFQPEEARSLVRGYCAPLAPGSYVVISVAHGNGEEGDRWFRTYSTIGPGQLHNYSVAQIAAFFDDTDLVPPGVVDARQWLPGQSDLPEISPRIGQAICGVGRIR